MAGSRLLAATTSALLLSAAAATASPTVTEFPAGATTTSPPTQLTAGPGGALWASGSANPGRVLSKAQLLEKLYDWGASEPESNALEVHVHHLRRKIHPGIVRTVRGVGYALGAEKEAA